MVVRQPLDVVVQRVGPGCVDDPGPAHGAAEEGVEAPRLRHRLSRPGDERAELQQPEALREAQADGVESRPYPGGGRPASTEVFSSGALFEVGREPGPRASAATPRTRAEREMCRAAVARVHVQTSRVGAMRRSAGGSTISRSCSGVKRPSRSSGFMTSPECTAAAELVAEHVRLGLGDDLVARVGERLQGDLLRHRRRRDEHGFLVSEQRGDALLERRNGRVLALLLVADDGARDRAAHALGRLRQRVRAEVDHALTVPGAVTGRSRPGARERTRNALPATARQASPPTVNASAVPPVAANHPASSPPAGAAPLKAKK